MHTKHLFEVQHFFHSRNTALISQMLLCLLLPSLVTVLSSTAVLRQLAAGAAQIAYKCQAHARLPAERSWSSTSSLPPTSAQTKLLGRTTWGVSPSCSQPFRNQLQRLAESGRLQVISCATSDLRQKVGNSPSLVTQGAVSSSTDTKQVKKQPCLQDIKVGQGRDEASCPSQGGKLWCFAPAESTHQSCQLNLLPKQLSFAEAWRNPWD